MALNFPNSPTVGQVYTDTTSGFSYEWDGTVWKSYSPASASNIKVLDDISGGFNSSTVTFALATSGVSLTPANAQSLIITLGGVTQEPGVDYTVNTSNITFTTAPDAGLSFSGISLGPAVPITYANDGNIYIRNTYVGSGTTGPFAFAQGYTVGYLDVYRNGIRLSSGTDFVGTSGTNFFLTDPAAVNDEIEAIGYTITSILNASTSFDNINVTGITTTNHLKVNTGSVFSGIATHNANVIVGVGYSVGIGTNNPPYHLTVTEVGAGPTPSLSYCIADFTNNINGYSQVNIRNASTGANASGDLVITTDNGTDTTNYIDLGINNSSYNNGAWSVNGPLDGYLYSSNTNFSIGVAFTNRYLSFFAGGTLAANEKMRVNDTGVGIGTTNVTSTLTVNGTVNANNFVGGAATFTNLTVNGTQTIINTTTLEVADKTVGIASTSTPSDSLADGAGIVVYGTTNKTLLYDNTRKGWDFNIPLTTDEVRFYNVAEKLTRVDGNTVSLAYSTNSSNIGFCTNPTGDITLAVTGIPTSSDFDNHTISFSVFVNQTGTARTCTAVTLNGVSRTIKWSGGSLSAALAGVTTSNGYDIFSFTGINTVGSASTAANYQVLGMVNGGFA